MHIQLDDDLVRELDQRVGPRQRSAFISGLIRQALRDEQRWDEIEASLGVISDTDHAWDDDPAGWVQEQRRDVRRTG
jgi:metal-responsive CopG/Arc/MetJ family transcriptional regulator